MIAGYRCVVCSATVDVSAVWPWRCPRATATDRHHVMRLVAGPGRLRGPLGTNAFVSDAPTAAWYAFARATGMTHLACEALVAELDSAVAAVAGVGFHVTPFSRADALSAALGFTDRGGVWLKDDTGNVAGSHKARHLFGILLHLEAAERLGLAPVRTRPRLAIASCGNAAIAASTLAKATGWSIDVFVPEWANEAVVRQLTALDATIVRCPRRDDDPPGDPCVHRFREAVASGSVPFSVQGPENTLCLDTARTLGSEIAQQGADAGVALTHQFIQTGGGAFATAIADGMRELLGPKRPTLYPVQAAGCAPLARAFAQAKSFGVTQGIERAAKHWAACMWPWEGEPVSLATGILDDETYDWLGIVEHLVETDGDVVVADEPSIAEANTLIRTRTGINADHTGTAGLAGLLMMRDTMPDSANVSVIVSGVQRS
jgi:threonine synthase